MAKPNYAFDKRQKELAKKQKKQEKLQQKAAIQNERNRDDAATPPANETTGNAD